MSKTTPESTYDMQKDAESAKAKDSFLDNLNVTGFSIICAWHFLIIFSAMPASGEEAVLGRPVIYQVALYLSLSISFLLLAFASKPLMRLLYKNGAKSWKRVNICFGIEASLATLLIVLVQGNGIWLETASWCIVGLSEAIPMFTWLQLANMRHDRFGMQRNFAFNMGVGGAIAFIIGNLVSPYNYIAMCLLPALANISLATIWDHENPMPQNDVEVEPLGKFGERIWDNSRFVFCGLAFGACQYLLSAEIGNDTSISYIVNDSWPLCGATLSAIIVLVVPAKSFQSDGLHGIQHFSALIFIASILVSYYFIITKGSLPADTTAFGDLAGQVLCFAGFNTFDFGYLLFALFWTSSHKSSLSSFIGLNRALLYLSMALGIGIGLGLHMSLEPILPAYEVAVLAGIIILLTASTLPCFNQLKPDAASKEAVEEKPEPVQETPAPPSPLERRLEEIADACQLSKRERQIFGFLAQGMSANEIQQELWISIHTVKTHMSNIYHKLDVHSARELIEKVNEDPNDKDLPKTNTQPK